MKVRELMNNNPAVVTIAAVVILILALWYAIGTLQGPRRVVITDAWYYDLNTGELFIDSVDKFAPIDAPSGTEPNGAPAGVRAHVFACGDCGDESKRFIGYLEMYTAEGKKLMESSQGKELNPDDMATYELGMNSLLVKKVEDPSWVLANSDQGYRVTQIDDGRCPPGEQLMPCWPGR